MFSFIFPKKIIKNFQQIKHGGCLIPFKKLVRGDSNKNVVLKSESYNTGQLIGWNVFLF